MQEGQNILNALIEEALAQGASEDEIANLKIQAATQGLGVAIDSGVNLTQTLAEQNAIRQQAYEDFRRGEWDGDQDIVDAWNAQQAALKLAEQQAGLTAYYEGMKAAEQAQTITSYIVATSQGETPHGTVGYQSIFAAGLVLFCMTLIFNILGYWLRRRFHQAY